VLLATIRSSPLLARWQTDGVSAQALRFIFAGILNTLFGYTVFSVATLWGAPAFLALAISTSAGVVFNFQTSRRIVFVNGAPGRWVRFICLYGGLFLANWIALRGLERLGLSALIVQGALVFPVAALSFIGQKTFVFQAPAPTASPASWRPLVFWNGLFRSLPLSPEVVGPIRVIVLVLAASSAAFIVAMEQPWIAAPTCIFMGLSLWALFGRSAPSASKVPLEYETQSTPWRLWAACALVALGLCLLGGEGRIFYANTDWQIRDAVLADLSRRPWPVTYLEPSGVRAVLRAPLGMFVMPALVGKLFGWRAAQPALLVQNTALLTAILMTFIAGARRWSERAVIVLVLFSFSGLDLIGEILIGHFAEPPGWVLQAPSLEPWSAGLQYSALVTDLFWAPNHALPALAMAASYMAWRRNQASSLVLAAVIGLGLLWSPLAVMGATPFLIVAGLTDLKVGRIGWLAPGALAPLVVALLPVAVYLTLAGSVVEHGLNIDRRAFRWYGPFILLEVLPLIYLASRGLQPEKREDRLDICLCALLLVAIPLYYIGGSNDFMMRASIFPIGVLAMMTARGVIADLARKKMGRLMLPLTLMAIGAATPGFEIARALVRPANPPTAANLFTAWSLPASRGTSMATYIVPIAAFERPWLFKHASANPASPETK
jgi:putative flippase GtrA